MKQTLKKEIKWRRDKDAIFVCNCKTLNDLKIGFKYEDFLKKLSSGVDSEELVGEEKQIFNEFQMLDYLTQLKTKQLPQEDIDKAMNILDNELGKDRVRKKDFLVEKYREYSEYFIGLYLGGELIGIICGFPREDYLLMSELAIDCRFQGKGWGKILVEEFEKIGFKKYKKINVGALDNAITFYGRLDYFPFLLVQFNNGEYSKKDFSDFEILSVRNWGIELKINSFSLEEINELRKKFPKGNLQYIFVKKS